MSVVELPEATVSKRLDRTDCTTIAAMGGIVLALHLFGWGVLVLGVAPQHITLGSAGVFGVLVGTMHVAPELYVRLIFPPITMKIRYDGPLMAPIAKGQEVAQLVVSTGDTPPQVVALVAGEDVGRAGFFGRIWLGLKQLIGMA